MAANILHLSNEVLMEIVDYLNDNQKSIRALVFTCRRLSPIARNAFYQNIVLDLSKDVSVFRSLYEKAWGRNLSLMTQTLKSIVIHGDRNREDYKDWHLARLLEVLAGAECLQTLTIYVWSTNQIEILISIFQDPKRNPFVALKRLDIRSKTHIFCAPSAGLSLILCAHPSLHEIRARLAVDIHRPTRDSHTPPNSQRRNAIGKRKSHIPPAFPERTAIKSLAMSGPLESCALEPILLSTPDLESLVIPIPDDHVFNYSYQNPLPVQSTILRPSKIGQQLSLVCQTLRQLKITSPYPIISRCVDSQIDLSKFQCLENLQISSILFLGNVPCMSKIAEVNIPSLLPANLKELSVCFDTLQGIFSSSADMRYMNSGPSPPITRDWSKLWCEGPGKPSVMTESFSWLHDLSVKCKTLQKFTLEETIQNKVLGRNKGGRSYALAPGDFLLIDVVPYHATFFASFSFKSKVSIYADSEWWAFVKRYPSWRLISEFSAVWVSLDDL